MPGLQLTDVGQHLGHGAVERARDLALEINRAIQDPGQRRGLDNGHAVLLAQLADHGGDVVHTFGHHTRRVIAAAVVLERHGEMRGVGDDDIGLGDGLHHPPPRGGLLQLADAAFNLGPAFRFLELIADFLPRHLQLFGVVEHLERRIHHRDQKQADAQWNQYEDRRLHAPGDRVIDGLDRQRQ